MSPTGQVHILQLVQVCPLCFIEHNLIAIPDLSSCGGSNKRMMMDPRCFIAHLNSISAPSTIKSTCRPTATPSTERHAGNHDSWLEPEPAAPDESEFILDFRSKNEDSSPVQPSGNRIAVTFLQCCPDHFQQQWHLQQHVGV